MTGIFDSFYRRMLADHQANVFRDEFVISSEEARQLAKEFFTGNLNTCSYQINAATYESTLRSIMDGTSFLFGKRLRVRKEGFTLKIKKLRPNAVIPKYAHGSDADAGFDLQAVEPTILKPFVPTLVKTGLSIELPPYYEAQIRPRSGLALKRGITVLNAPGTVDPSYRGEIGVILWWNGHSASGGPWATPGNGAEIIIQEGDRIAQMVIARYEPVVFEVVQELASTERGEGGFGSTGA